MNSEEALLELRSHYFMHQCESDEWADERFGSIEQDLEALKIIKKKTHNDGWGNGYVVHFWEMEEDELEKIKKWWEEK